MNNNRKILLIRNSLPIRGAFGEVSVRFPDHSSTQRSVHLPFWSHRLTWGELLGETTLRVSSDVCLQHTSIPRLLQCSLTVPAKPLMFLQRLPQPLLTWIFCLSWVLGATWTPVLRSPAHSPSTPRLQPRSVLVRAPGMRRPHAATLKGTAPGTQLLSNQSGGNRA